MMETDLELDSNVELQAAEWVVTLHSLSQGGASSNPEVIAERNAQFVLWLQQSTRHVAAFMRTDDEFCRLEGMDPKREIDIEQLLCVALRDSEVPHEQSPAVKMSRRRATLKIALAASMLVAASALIGWLAYQHALVFVTGVGEQRVVKLPDGSTMMLNTSSRASVDFSTSERRIRLDEGEALFSVEHDTSRPFLVFTPTAIVRAVGTQFDVYQRPNATTTITVLEGVVRFASRDDSSGGGSVPLSSKLKDNPPPASDPTAQPSVPLAAGQQAHIIHKTVSTSNDANGPDLIAWRDRLLVFRGRALTEVADEFNRYNTVQIRILDPEIGRIPMSGTFSVDRPQILAFYLREDARLEVEQHGNEWIVRKRN